MWVFVGYLLWKLREKGFEVIRFNEFASFAFRVVLGEYKVKLANSDKHLEDILCYIEKLGYIEFDREKGVIVLRDSLEDFGVVVGASPLRTESVLYREYVSRIEKSAEKARYAITQRPPLAEVPSATAAHPSEGSGSDVLNTYRERLKRLMELLLSQPDVDN